MLLRNIFENASNKWHWLLIIDMFLGMNLINDIDYVFGNRTNTIKMIEQCNWHSFLSTAPNERDQVWFLFGSRCPKSLIFSGYIQFFLSHIFTLYLPISASLSSHLFLNIYFLLSFSPPPYLPSVSLPLFFPASFVSLSIPLYYIPFTSSLPISPSLFSLLLHLSFYLYLGLFSK